MSGWSYWINLWVPGGLLPGNSCWKELSLSLGAWGAPKMGNIVRIKQFFMMAKHESRFMCAPSHHKMTLCQIRLGGYYHVDRLLPGDILPSPRNKLLAKTRFITWYLKHLQIRKAEEMKHFFCDGYAWISICAPHGKVCKWFNKTQFYNFNKF